MIETIKLTLTEDAARIRTTEATLFITVRKRSGGIEYVNAYNNKTLVVNYGDPVPRIEKTIVVDTRRNEVYHRLNFAHPNANQAYWLANCKKCAPHSADLDRGPYSITRHNPAEALNLMRWTISVWDECIPLLSKPVWESLEKVWKYEGIH